jgi:hypothetical protein
MWCPPFRLKSNVKPSGKLVSPYDALAVMGKIGKSFAGIKSNKFLHLPGSVKKKL